MARAFKLNTIKSDGTAVDANALIAFEVIDPSTGKPFKDDEGRPSVVIQLRPISQAKYRAVVQQHTERIPSRKGQPPRDETDWDAVQDALVSYAIESWVGIIGADDQPLQCVLDAKLGLPGDLKNEVITRAMQGEAVDQTAASFR